MNINRQIKRTFDVASLNSAKIAILLLHLYYFIIIINRSDMAGLHGRITQNYPSMFTTTHTAL